MRTRDPQKILNYVYRLYITKDPLIVSHRKWVKDKADHLILDYNLSENSIVFDLGGYQGNWTNDIYNKYRCNIIVFEPVLSFYKNIKKRFEFNDKIKIYNCGLSNTNKNTKIFLNKDASTVFDEGKQGKNLGFEIITLVDIIDVIKKHNIQKIDLMKINIEGGEYEVLPRLIDSDYVKLCKNLQIQFHRFVKNAESMRNDIRLALTRTHHLTYDYPWIYENWELNH